jgi:hypothetical protein
MNPRQRGIDQSNLLQALEYMDCKKGFWIILKELPFREVLLPAKGEGYAF